MKKRSAKAAPAAAQGPTGNMDPGRYSRLFGGLAVMLGLTYRCQCTCSACGMGAYRKDSRGEFTTRQWLDVMDGFPAATRSVAFFGGEPTLRSDLPDLIRGAKQRGFDTSVDTNGYLLSPAYVAKLKKAGLDMAFISLDSWDPATHDRLRGRPGIFNKVLSALQSCRREGLSSVVSTYATKENLRDGGLQKVLRLAEKLQANFVRVLPPLMTGKWLKAEDVRLNAAELKLLKSHLREGFSYLEDDYCMSINKKIVYVSPYGDVQPCCYVPFTLGNVKEAPLREIVKKLWRHPLYGAKSKTCVMNNKEFRKKFLSKIEPSKGLPARF